MKSTLPYYLQQITSKYFITYKDYDTLFLKNNNINTLYYTTFNYIFLDSHFVLSKNEANYIIDLISKQFPNAKTIELNYNIHYITDISKIGNIIKNYELFNKINSKYKYKINIYSNISKLNSRYELNKTNLHNKLYVLCTSSLFTKNDIKLLNKFYKLSKLHIINNIELIMYIITFYGFLSVSAKKSIKILLHQPYKIVCYINRRFINNNNFLDYVAPKYINNDQLFYTYDEIFIIYKPILFNNLNDERDYLSSHCHFDFIYNHIKIINLLGDNILLLLKEKPNDIVNINHNIRIKTYNSLKIDYINLIYRHITTINNTKILINKYHNVVFGNNNNINNYLLFINSLKSKFNYYNNYNISLIHLLNH
jgi:hypothetical protein